jgi:glycosyltransferase involved in cell wall biosynthesis
MHGKRIQKYNQQVMGLKIAILGTRGVPNHYGGFEHIAGYLAKGLVQRDHQVTVYNSSKHPYQQKEWHGVEIIHCYDPEHLIGVAGQFVYDLLCMLDARKKKYDIILMLGYTSSSIWGALYPSEAIVINNMDGLEWKRSKYSRPVRRFLKYAERLAVQASKYQIADSPLIKTYLDAKYMINSKYIAYGAELEPSRDLNVLKDYDLKKGQYFLLMARMEPENNIEMILEGYTQTDCLRKFIVIGNTNNSFGKRLVARYKHDSRIVFAGAIFDNRKTQSLASFCTMYFHGHSVGGSNPSLLDAMAARIPIAAHQNPFNRSLLEKNAWYFNTPQEVSGIINKYHYYNDAFLNNNYTTIKTSFTWEKIIDQYENYFLDCYFEAQCSIQPFRVKEI